MFFLNNLNSIAVIVAYFIIILQNQGREKNRKYFVYIGMKRQQIHRNNHHQRPTSSFNSRNFKFPNSLKCFEHETESIARLRLYVSDTKRQQKKNVNSVHNVQVWDICYSLQPRTEESVGVLVNGDQSHTYFIPNLKQIYGIYY